MSTENMNNQGITRRNFLKGTAATAAVIGLASIAPTTAEAAPKSIFQVKRVKAKKKAKAFPTELEYAVNYANPYEMPFQGMFFQEFAVNEINRRMTVYIPTNVIPNDYVIFVGVPSGVDAAKFIQQTGWTEVADKYAKYVVALEPADGKWGSVEEELPYITNAVSKAKANVYFKPTTSTFYFVGYGDGGNIVQRYLLSGPNNAAAAAIFDGSTKIDASILEEQAQKNMSAYCSKKYGEYQLPIWLFEKKFTKKAKAVADYWLTANGCAGTTPTYTRTGLTEIYRQPVTNATLEVDGYAMGRVRLTTAVMDYYNANIAEYVWTEFLKETCRINSIPIPTLRPSWDAAEIGYQYVSLVQSTKFSDVNRYYMMYVPSRYDASKPTPVLFAFGGDGQTPEAFAEQTEWHRVAEARNFILVFPAAVPYNRHNGKMPIPFWNCGLYEDHVNDFDFMKQIIEDLANAQGLNIDRKRIYASGQSLGGQFAHMVSLFLTDVFTASAFTGGILVNDFINEAFAAKDSFVKGYRYPVWFIQEAQGTALASATLSPEKAAGIGMAVNSVGWQLYRNGLLKFTPEEEAAFLAAYDVKNVDCLAVRDLIQGAVAAGNTYQSGLYYHNVFTNEAGVPMVQYTVNPIRGHMAVPSELWTMWDGFFSKYYRDENGEICYMQDAASDPTFIR